MGDDKEFRLSHVYISKVGIISSLLGAIAGVLGTTIVQSYYENSRELDYRRAVDEMRKELNLDRDRERQRLQETIEFSMTRILDASSKVSEYRTNAENILSDVSDAISSINKAERAVLEVADQAKNDIDNSRKSMADTASINNEARQTLKSIRLIQEELNKITRQNLGVGLSEFVSAIKSVNFNEIYTQGVVLYFRGTECPSGWKYYDKDAFIVGKDLESSNFDDNWEFVSEGAYRRSDSYENSQSDWSSSAAPDAGVKHLTRCFKE